jgi:glycosyltransferase involved in cell wall biosynthesis
MADPEPPLVSVLMPAYNHESFVREAIESVWAQTHRNLELLVIDDGSTDSTLQIVRSLQPGSRVPMHVEAQPNQGIAPTLNRLVSRAKGEWLAFLSSDDFYAPDYIERNLAEAARSGKDEVVVHSDAYLVEASGAVTGTLSSVSGLEPLRGQVFDRLVTGEGNLMSATIFLRCALLMEAGGFDATMIAEDLDLQLRLARRAEFRYIDQPIYYARHTPGSLGKRPWLWGDSIIGAIAKHEDILGDRLAELLAKSSRSIAMACFEQGEIGWGVHWSRKALAYARGSKAAAALGLAAGSLQALSRSAAISLFGRERLVHLKRRLQRR